MSPLSGPLPVDGDGIAGNPRLGAGQQAIFAQHPVDERGFARIGPPDDGELQRAGRHAVVVFFHLVHRDQRIARFGFLADDRPEGFEEVGGAFAMFGGNAERFAKAQRIGIEDAAVAAAPLGLVGDHDDRDVRRAQPVTDLAVERGQPGAGIDHEQHRVRIGDAHFGLCAHATRQGARVLVFPTGGIDDREFHARQLHIAESAVARDAWLVVDQRQFLADQPVEQRGFAHIGATDDDDARKHDWCASGASAPAWQAFQRLLSEPAQKG